MLRQGWRETEDRDGENDRETRLRLGERGRNEIEIERARERETRNRPGLEHRRRKQGSAGGHGVIFDQQDSVIVPKGKKGGGMTAITANNACFLAPSWLLTALVEVARSVPPN
ncbi:hypothetical protein KM043_007810 [Ampulex compressa]|nr:hypothetical protein KM043_007810 [Ampulex compressa]